MLRHCERMHPSSDHGQAPIFRWSRAGRVTARSSILANSQRWSGFDNAPLAEAARVEGIEEEGAPRGVGRGAILVPKIQKTWRIAREHACTSRVEPPGRGGET